MSRHSFLALFLIISLALVSSTAVADPVYQSDKIKDALDDAKQNQRVVVWFCSSSDLLSEKNPDYGSQAEITQLCLYQLRNQDDSCVIIFLSGLEDIAKAPNTVQDQFLTVDDPQLNGTKFHMLAPKLVFTDPAETTVFGRLSYTTLQQDRDKALLDMVTHAAHQYKESRNAAGSHDPGQSTSASDPAASSPLDGYIFKNRWLLIFGGTVAAFFGLILLQMNQYFSGTPEEGKTYSHPTQRIDLQKPVEAEEAEEEEQK